MFEDPEPVPCYIAKVLTCYLIYFKLLQNTTIGLTNKATNTHVKQLIKLFEMVDKCVEMEETTTIEITTTTREVTTLPTQTTTSSGNKFIAVFLFVSIALLIR